MLTSRKLIFSLTATAALASASLAPADAAIATRHGGYAGPHLHRTVIVRRPPVRIVRHEPVFVRPIYTARPLYGARVTEPGLCTCLSKTYTPDGLVVFKDLCTQEMATAQVESNVAQAPAEQTQPDNFAGKTYQDYLKSNLPAAPSQQPPSN